MNQNLLDLQEIKNHSVFDQLYGSSLALALTEYIKFKPGIKLIIAPDNYSAKQLMDEIEFFLKDTDPKHDLLFFPDWEILPYDHFSPHQSIISERLFTLSQLNHLKSAIIISSTSTLMHRLCPPSFISLYALILKEGQNLDVQAFRRQMQEAGYYPVSKVMEHGEYVIRGSIIDIYPMGAHLPYRIELDDELIVSMRIISPDTQRSIKKISRIDILPAREFPLNESSKTLFRRSFREQFPGNPTHCPIYEAISSGHFPNGIEYFLPFFFKETVSLFDHISKSASICLVGNIEKYAQVFFNELEKRYEQQRHDITRPILMPEQFCLKPETYMNAINAFEHISFYNHFINLPEKTHSISIAPEIELTIDRKSNTPFIKLSKLLQDTDYRHLLVVESLGRREVITELLKKSQISAKAHASWFEFISDSNPFGICIGPLEKGAVLIHQKINLIVESQIFGEEFVPQKHHANPSINPDLIIRDLAQIRVGEPVVHIQFGVGRYYGLETIEHQGQENEFLVLTYADEAKIYVPVTSLHLISRYTGSDAEHAPLHRLGSDLWVREKIKAKEKIYDAAVAILDTYLKREAKPGFQYHINGDDYDRFISAFPFEETIDQQKAIKEIIEDMQSKKPMDRLICGDVGFGKTEVAMRAAFIAVQNGKQVCVLVPTTLLAGQHFETFTDRFAEFPINIALLSRFCNAKASQEVKASLESGKVDIVIGTHKLFSKEIKFHQLGLLIIDEEHRFGVKQKEHIKALRTNIDILSMTATPIPRTLNMAMSGIRDISLIATPPAKRLAIKTFWQEKNNYIIREALLREILRGGQVFFVHNNITTIKLIHAELEKLVPEAKIQIAHGQMRERDLEHIMSDFYHHRFNVLLSTTIIETGIDIPTANTMIIDRADKFGLAQLHQLRGRVGRSHHQAYAYLLTPNREVLSADAIKRLEAIVSLEDLGAGFTLATHDLEIRGAGELLGEGQSGNIHAIGFSLYMELLDKAVSDLKAGKTPMLDAPISQGPEIDLHLSTMIPNTYVSDVHTRLIIYKQIANAQSEETLKELQIDLIDRFGLFPLEVKQLFAITELKLLAASLGILKIQSDANKGSLIFDENPSINSMALIHLIQKDSKHFRLEGPKRLCFALPGLHHEARIQWIHHLLIKLSPKEVAVA